MISRKGAVDETISGDLYLLATHMASRRPHSVATELTLRSCNAPNRVSNTTDLHCFAVNLSGAFLFYREDI